MNYSKNYIDVDYGTWLSMPLWTTRETCFLFCGLNPSEHQSFDDLIDIVPVQRVYRFIDAAAHAGELKPDSSDYRGTDDSLSKSQYGIKAVASFNPINVVKWAVAKGFMNLPPPVQEWYEQQQPIHEPEAKLFDDNLHPRERNTLLKIIAVMAHDGYNNDLSEPYGKLAQIVSEQADLLGISITAETIGDKFKEAKQFTPDSN